MGVWDPYLKRFLECTMELLLMKEYDMELTDYAGEALLALMVCQQTHYTNLVTSLLSSQPNPSIQTRLSNAFTSLTSSMKEPDIIASVMSTRDLAGFKTKLHQFLLQTRGVLMSDVSFGSR
ncbi:hypothetical protein BKA69DRAFT_899780 [Paraphysoderma sedebokerense]|nr:hypothetical protein BKA69DRAFT_899780 [Paraphysoderma sedebokerense]